MKINALALAAWGNRPPGGVLAGRSSTSEGGHDKVDNGMAAAGVADSDGTTVGLSGQGGDGHGGTVRGSRSFSKGEDPEDYGWTGGGGLADGSEGVTAAGVAVGKPDVWNGDSDGTTVGLSGQGGDGHEGTVRGSRPFSKGEDPGDYGWTGGGGLADGSEGVTTAGGVVDKPDVWNVDSDDTTIGLSGQGGDGHGGTVRGSRPFSKGGDPGDYGWTGGGGLADGSEGVTDVMMANLVEESRFVGGGVKASHTRGDTVDVAANVGNGGFNTQSLVNGDGNFILDLVSSLVTSTASLMSTSVTFVKARPKNKKKEKTIEALSHVMGCLLTVATGTINLSSRMNASKAKATPQTSARRPSSPTFISIAVMIAGASILSNPLSKALQPLSVAAFEVNAIMEGGVEDALKIGGTGIDDNFEQRRRLVLHRRRRTTTTHYRRDNTDVIMDAELEYMKEEERIVEDIGSGGELKFGDTGIVRSLRGTHGYSKDGGSSRHEDEVEGKDIGGEGTTRKPSGDGEIKAIFGPSSKDGEGIARVENIFARDGGEFMGTKTILLDDSLVGGGGAESPILGVGDVASGPAAILSSVPSNEEIEPFTMTSIQPELLTKALEEARGKAFDFAAGGIGEILDVNNGIPDFLKNISLESIGVIQTKLIEIFDNLEGVNLGYLGNIVDLLSDFSPDAALDKVLAPEDTASCPAPNLSVESLSGLPDISGVKDAARALSSHLFHSLSSTLSDPSIDLGFPISIPQISRRDLQDDSRFDPQDDFENFPKVDVCPKGGDKDWGVSIALGASLDASSGSLKKIAFGREFDFKLTGSAGVTIEAGFDSGINDGSGGPAIGFAFNPPLTAFSFTVSGSFVDCTAGFVCDGNGGRTLCPEGQYCTGDKTEPDGFCHPGFFCPPGSTREVGKPVDNYDFTEDRGLLGKRKYRACHVGRFCRCRQGFFCPEGSTTPLGNPRIASILCQLNQKCMCPLGSYCVTGSFLPRECPNKSTCSGLGCRNPECTFFKGDPQQRKRNIIRRLVDKILPIATYEVSLGVSFQGYWDISAAPWNGSNGHGVTIDLPFKLLPSVTLLFGAPPFHCLANSVYSFSGIGIDFASLSQTIDFSDVDGQNEKDKSASKSLKDAFKEKIKSFTSLDSLKEKVTFFDGTEFSGGVGYSYDASFNDVNGRYKWCGACESCSDCDTCARASVDDDASEDCLLSKENECKISRQCSSVALSPSTSLAKKLTAFPPSTSPPTKFTTFHSKSPTSNLAISPSTSPSKNPTIEDISGQTRSLSISGTSSAILPQSDFTELTRLISTFSSIFSGNFVFPFCWGDGCSNDPRDPSSVIQGVIKSTFTKDCSGLVLSTELPQLTVGQVLSVLFGALPDNQFLKPLLDFGINHELELGLAVSGTSKLTLSARLPSQDGMSPSFGDGNGDILAKILNFIELLRLEFYGRVQRTTGGPDLVAGVCVSIGLADNERCLDLLDGNAPSPTPSGSEGFKGVSIAEGRLRFEHFIFQVGFRKPPSLPSWESFLEVAFGMRICPEVECKEGPSSPGLFLQGSIRGELSVTGFSAGGGLRQIGTYSNAFGFDRLHVSDFYCNAQFGQKFPIPDKLNIGGQICVGSEADCLVADLDRTVRAGAFLGFSVDEPTDNYVVAFVQQLTLGNVLRSLGMKEFSDALPPELGDSGILRPATAPASCDEEYELPASVDEAAVGLPSLDLECVAYVAITSKEVHVPGIDTPIEAGFSVAGRLLIQYGILLDMSVDAAFNPITGAFRIEALLKVDLPKDNPVATIRGTGGNDEPARLFVKKTALPSLSLAVMIDCRLDIEAIKTSGNVTVSVDSKRLKATGELELLGILQTNGEIELYWDMSYFRVAVDEFGINTDVGFFGLSDILLKFESPGSDGTDWDLLLEGKFEVAGFDLFSGSLEVSEANDKFQFNAAITITCLVDFSISGEFDLFELGDSSIHSFNVGPDLDCLTEIGGVIVDGMADVTDAAGKGLRDLEDDLQKACKEATTPIDSGFNCLGADLAGGMARAFEDATKTIQDREFTGPVSEVISDANEDEIDCVAYVSVAQHGIQSSDGKFSYSGDIQAQFKDDHDMTNPPDGMFETCIGITAAAAVLCGGLCFPVVMAACFAAAGILGGGFGDQCPDPSDGRNIPVAYSDDVGRASIGNKIQNNKDEKGCEKRALYKSARPIFGTDMLGVYTDVECYNDIIQLEREITPLIAKADDLISTRISNACLLEDFEGNGPRINGNDAFEIASPIPYSGDTYKEVFEIKERPTETQEGLIILKFKTREFTPDGMGGCEVSSLGDKECHVTVPKGPEGSLNRFIERRLKFELNKCITGSLVENSPGITLPKTPVVATLELQPVDTMITTTCSMFDDIEDKNRPSLIDEDMLCKANEKSPQFFFDDSNPTQVVGDSVPCGTLKITRTWTAVDGCGVEANSQATQVITILPNKPTFDVTSMPDIQFTTSQNPIPPRAQYPSATSYCRGRTDVDYEDVSITTVDTGNSCKHWTMMRKWTAWEDLNGCYGQDRPTSHPLIQIVTITDDVSPEFIDIIKRVRVPFFANYQPNNNVPRVKDASANLGYGDFASQLANNVTLASIDNNFTKATVESSNATCSTNGLAQFTRTWTILDTCENKYEASQSIIIEHPPQVLTITDVLEDDLFFRSIGVGQGLDVCVPGKDVQLGHKVYTTTGPSCPPGGWDGDGCQVISATNDVEMLEYLKNQQAISPRQAALEAYRQTTLPQTLALANLGFDDVTAINANTFNEMESQYVEAYLDSFYSLQEVHAMGKVADPLVEGVIVIERNDHRMGEKLFTGSPALISSSEKGNRVSDFDRAKPSLVKIDRALSRTSIMLLAIKPEFTYRPPDVTISTADSPLPLDTGEAEGSSFCSTPYEIVYADATPQKQGCGRWMIARAWTIRPIYQDCQGGVSDLRLVDSFVQQIIVEDRDPPEFVETPSSNVDVSFLQNYGPDATGVPLIEDRALGLAELTDDQGLPLASYPTRLTYNDTVSFPDLNDCDQESLAIIQRRWSATDGCEQSSNWTQTISIMRSSGSTIGDASVYQVITTGPSHLSHTDIAEEFATSGKNDTSMDHVLLSSGLQSNSWDGSDPAKLDSVARENRPFKISKKHRGRGVNYNPSICTGNGLDHSFVMESCPKHERMKDVFLVKKSAGLGPERRPQEGKSGKGDSQCVLDKLRFGEDDATLEYFEEGEQPLRFGMVSDAIESFSDKLAYNMPALMTGPKMIRCLSQDQNSCSETKSSDSNQDGEILVDNETVTLIGSGMVYNIFDITLDNWFYTLPKPISKSSKSGKGMKSPKVLVQSSGFVFVNAKYKSALKLTQQKEGKGSKAWKPEPSVLHDFQSSKLYQSEEEFYLDFPQPFGDPWMATGPLLSNEGRDANTNSSQWVPRRVEFDSDTLGQEYFLLNIPNPEIIYNPDNITNAKEVTALAFSFTDSEAVTDPIIWAGTLILGNKHTSLRVKNSTWVGGQIILAGGELELIESSVLCGKYAANRPCVP